MTFSMALVTHLMIKCVFKKDFFIFSFLILALLVDDVEVM